mmetsp:Transcript_68771/g.111595  ORF Transcript_68771/g.111595 Transcript_68771/m.111595 type:complete len:229 (-) Transcript_68771:333-1019(-)
MLYLGSGTFCSFATLTSTCVVNDINPSALILCASCESAGRRLTFAYELSSALRVSKPATGTSLIRSTRSPGFSDPRTLVAEGMVVTSQYGVDASWIVKRGVPPFSITSVISLLPVKCTRKSSIDDTEIPSTSTIRSPSWQSRSSRCTLLMVRSGRSFMLSEPPIRGTPTSNLPRFLSRIAVWVGVLSSAFRYCTGEAVTKDSHSASSSISFRLSTHAIVAEPPRFAAI